MKKFLLNLLIPVLTFAVGVGIYRFSIPAASLQNIANYTAFYDGVDVQIETYAQLADSDQNYFYLGDFDEKTKALFLLNTEKSSINLASLHNELIGNFSDKHFKRVKVLVIGKVQDNCKTDGLTFGCCFGRTITIKAQEVKQLEPIEDYTMPE